MEDGVQSSGRPSPDRITGVDRAPDRTRRPSKLAQHRRTVFRHIHGGLHEDIEVTNNSLNTVRFNLEIAIRADFADIFEVKGGSIVRRGRITTAWSEKRQDAAHQLS